MSVFSVLWLCIFTLKVFSLIDLTWRVVAPLSLLAALDLMENRK